MSDGYGIMDTGNNNQHVFKTDSYFASGMRWHDVSITGVHGAQTVRVGIGTAHFSTTTTDNDTINWKFTNSLYNPKSPVNLLCADLFHYKKDGTDTGHTYLMKEEILLTKAGKAIPVVRDIASKLPLVKLHTVHKSVLYQTHARTQHTLNANLAKLDSKPVNALYTHTH